ncbi:hypothetical protein G4Y79_15630 [Phototrophicus methaneseepsis]|uniref:Uncharacterized protein n=1 Tax=Phototrophicus methaneseepsis TaxID=2710758 RepID=A0A7S8IDS9_9CHLR|nr:hypothetical protein [Phototrophicus methaneseepsis]QPC81133.1 hypothetical protein G4Y79_15630 [Phototrophicus methaneseepsis]
MAAIASGNAVRTSEEKQSFWLRDRKWDLLFITFSVIVVPLPYLAYLFGRDVFGISDDVARNVVNGFVAVAIGGPHMMSTFLRTGLDNTFNKRYPMLIRSSIIIPIIVIALAFLNLTLLLTVFFFWASIHVLHQVTYIVELYNHKEGKYVRHSAVSWSARMIDYAIILTCLFPIAAYKISQGSFEIGTNDLGQAIPDFFEQPWFFVVMSGVFFLALAAYVIKTFREYREGTINWPKTAFITITVIVAFFTPMLPNLDTAFQGLNTWHSFQYLAITFYIIKIRQEYGKLDEESPLVARFSRQSKDSRGLYMLSTILLGGSLVIFILVYAITSIVSPNIDSNAHFDTAYYTAILSFLWIHYYHDHFLFTDFESLDKAYQ